MSRERKCFGRFFTVPDDGADDTALGSDNFHEWQRRLPELFFCLSRKLQLRLLHNAIVLEQPGLGSTER